MAAHLFLCNYTQVSQLTLRCTIRVDNYGDENVRATLQLFGVDVLYVDCSTSFLTMNIHEQPSCHVPETAVRHSE
jgi:hypothetical protein